MCAWRHNFLALLKFDFFIIRGLIGTKICVELSVDGTNGKHKILHERGHDVLKMAF